jgi:UDP-glucose:(heptosyl)LPS alpha-1,3-glucosyltransferase
MRIALCHKRLDERGGTERDFHLTAKGLRDLGHEIHLFCSEFAIEPPSGTFAHKVPVLPFGRTAELWSFALHAPKLVQKFNCDVVVSFGRMMAQDVLRSGGGSHKVFLQRLGKQAGLRRRIWQKISVYHRSVLAIEKRQFGAGGFKKAIAVSREVKHELRAAYAVPKDKIAVLYNGVDPQRFHPSLRAKWRNTIRNEWGIPLGTTVVLFVGSGFRRKGLDRLIGVWGSASLKDSFLLVVGDDARMRAYKAWATKQAPGRIIFLGRQDKVERFYGAADLLALPSIQEGFGNVILEALACGLPVVASGSVGAAEVLTGSLAEGVIERPDDVAELKAKLIHMIGKCREPETALEARSLGEAYSWKNHFHKLEACLMEVSRQDNRGLAS